MAVLLLLCTSTAPAFGTPSGEAPDAPMASSPKDCFQIEDFEGYQAGSPPEQWYTNEGRDLTPANESTMSPSHRLTVRSEGGNRFVRVEMQNYAYRLIRLSGKHFPEWNTSECPRLSWRWRVNAYPEGANETDSGNNDVAAAVYVTFSRDWLGRPRSIKYTYSSTQPVGTTVDYGTLKVLVVASAKDGSPTRAWQRFERDVVRDYKNLFGKAPSDDTPLGIQLFSDADAGDGTRRAEADFDDVRVMQPR